MLFRSMALNSVAKEEKVLVQLNESIKMPSDDVLIMRKPNPTTTQSPPHLSSKLPFQLTDSQRQSFREFEPLILPSVQCSDAKKEVSLQSPEQQKKPLISMLAYLGNNIQDQERLPNAEIPDCVKPSTSIYNIPYQMEINSFPGPSPLLGKSQDSAFINGCSSNNFKIGRAHV